MESIELYLLVAGFLILLSVIYSVVVVDWMPSNTSLLLGIDPELNGKLNDWLSIGYGSTKSPIPATETINWKVVFVGACATSNWSK